MHQETLTTLHLSQEKTQEYLAAQIDQAVERHGSVLRSLIRQTLPAEGPPTRQEAHVNGLAAGTGESEEDHTGLQMMQATLDVAQSFADVMSNRGSAVDRSSSGGSIPLRSPRGPTNVEMKDPDNGGETLLSPHDSVSNVEPSEVGGEDIGIAYHSISADLRNVPSAHSAASRRQDGFNSQVVVDRFPSELMTNWLENYIAAAEKDLQERNYSGAMRYLDLANQKGESRQTIHKLPFEEKLRIEILQAAAHIGLEELVAAESLLQSIVTRTAEDSLKRGEAYYLLATVQRAQYLRANDAALLEHLEEAAERSYAFALRSDAIPKPYLIESAQIMVDMYGWKGDSVARDLFRDRHPSMPVTAVPAAPAASPLAEHPRTEPPVSPLSRTRERLYSSESQILTSPPSLLTVETQSTISSFGRTSLSPLGSEPTTAQTSCFQPSTSINLLTQVQNGAYDMVEFLLNGGADIEQIEEKTGMTPLLVAAKLHNKNICRLLLTNKPNKADIHAQCREGRSVLHAALSGLGGEDVIPLLLEHKANPNVVDKDGKTPLHYCAEQGKKDAAQELLAVSAAMEAETHTGETPLRLAIRRKKGDVVEVLLNSGAEVDDMSKRIPTTQHIDYLLKKHLGQLSRPR